MVWHNNKKFRGHNQVLYLIYSGHNQVHILEPSERHASWRVLLQWYIILHHFKQIYAVGHSSAVGFAVSWKWCYQHVRTSFCPEKMRNWCCFSPQNDLDPSDLSIEMFPASSPGAQLQGITFGTFPIQLGQIRFIITIGDRIGKKRFFRSNRGL